MSAIEDLLHTLFERGRPPWADEFAEWVRGSRRYRAFVTAYQTKIRARLRVIVDEAGLLDLRAELAKAAHLLADERFTLVYEQVTGEGRRGPDFTATFRTHTQVHIEVRRLRPPPADSAAVPRMMAVLVDKIGQTQPQALNVLWLAAGDEPMDTATAAVRDAAASLRELAERKADSYFAQRGYRDSVAFLHHLARLSAVLVQGQPGASALWPNPLARLKLSPELARAVSEAAELPPSVMS